ncbi:MAG TPA: helix-turn-helix transcriptional regulator [Candidatus Dormibacteraeota bacterium]|jgi:transcriptional regulator with XRE-family HTH domain|nr:helix-turn-helix transcriptional regulator [Candidatus Dormibacteraeota bacterium]
MEQFGHNLRKERQRLGMSQAQLARIAGLHWTSVQKIEYGRRSVRLHTLLMLAYALDVDPCGLLEGLRP